MTRQTLRQTFHDPMLGLCVLAALWRENHVKSFSLAHWLKRAVADGLIEAPPADHAYGSLTNWWREEGCGTVESLVQCSGTYPLPLVHALLETVVDLETLRSLSAIRSLYALRPGDPNQTMIELMEPFWDGEELPLMVSQLDGLETLTGLETLQLAVLAKEWGPLDRWAKRVTGADVELVIGHPLPVPLKKRLQSLGVFKTSPLF